MAALGLCCCAGAFSSGPCGFLIAGTSLVVGAWASFSGCSFGAPPRGEVQKKNQFLHYNSYCLIKLCILLLGS